MDNDVMPYEPCCHFYTQTSCIANQTLLAVTLYEQPKYEHFHVILVKQFFSFLKDYTCLEFYAQDLPTQDGILCIMKMILPPKIEEKKKKNGKGTTTETVIRRGGGEDAGARDLGKPFGKRKLDGVSRCYDWLLLALRATGRCVFYLLLTHNCAAWDDEGFGKSL